VGLVYLRIRRQRVSPDRPRLPRHGQFRRVAFTDPFTDWSPDLRRLNLSALLVAAAPWLQVLGQASPREATAQRPGLDAVTAAKIIRSEED
jgi:hypothetical protein